MQNIPRHLQLLHCPALSHGHTPPSQERSVCWDTDVYRIYQNGEAIPVELFINEPFIMREDGSGTRQEMEKALVYGKPVFKNVDVIARMSNPAAIKQVVSRGLFPSCPSRSSSGRRSRIISAISASAAWRKNAVFIWPTTKGPAYLPLRSISWNSSGKRHPGSFMRTGSSRAVRSSIEKSYTIDSLE